MTNAQLQKILRLVRKTHDRVVVADAAGSDVFVLLPLETYENLLGTDSSGRPLEPSPEDLFAPSGEEISSEAEEPAGILPAEEEQVPFAPAAGGEKSLEFNSGWAEHNATGPEEDLSTVPEEPEEQFYLEPVE